MAETINLKKRLIGKEDINFDITGTNEQENFFTADGGQKKLSKINASHFPLTRDAREKLNATNVDEALVLLSDKVDDFEAADVLTEDITINFLPEDNAETIQNKINQQKKNLNGHTLTFLFPTSLQQNLYSPLEWNDFYNGTVVIAGGREDSRIAIYDNLDINSLFRFYRCQCEVRIEYFYFVHQKSRYAVSAESSSAVILKDCFFSGMEEVDSYAVRLLASNGELVDCQLSNDFDYDTLLSEKLNDLEETKAQTDLANITEVGAERIQKEAAMRVWESTRFAPNSAAMIQFSPGLGVFGDSARAEVIAECKSAYYGWQPGEQGRPLMRGNNNMVPPNAVITGETVRSWSKGVMIIQDFSGNTSGQVYVDCSATYFDLFIRIYY